MVVLQKRTLICGERYKDTRGSAIYARIRACRDEAYGYLNEILTERVATPSKGRKTTFTLQDFERLKPFHWAYDFDEVMNHSWWMRCDPKEALVIEAEGQVRGIRFGS